MVNESFIRPRRREPCPAFRHSGGLTARDKELGQAQAGQDGSGLVGSRQGRLQLQDFACDLIGRNRLGLVDEVLEHGLGLGLACGSSLHLRLRGREIGLDVREGLLTRLRRQIGCNTGAERCGLRGRIGRGR